MPKQPASDLRNKRPQFCLRNRLFIFLVYSFIFIKSISHYYLISKLFFCHIVQFSLILSFFHTMICLICATVFILIKSDCPENFNRFFYTQKVLCLLILTINTENFLIQSFIFNFYNLIGFYIHILLCNATFTVSTPATLPGSSEALYPPAASPRGYSVISHMPSFPVLPYQSVYW